MSPFSVDQNALCAQSHVRVASKQARQHTLHLFQTSKIAKFWPKICVCYEGLILLSEYHTSK